ncbi:MAG: hypothetical protein IH818_12650 [Acidobacteria bacterium]|nr:hypothetical protein [Acidobacteriota bacterium]
MSDAATYLDDHDVDRRELLRNVLIGGGVVAAAFAAPGFTGVAQAAGGKSIVLDVDANDFNDFEATGGATGAFYVSGVIFAPGTFDQIGDFLCWGYIPAAGFPVVNQEFDITGRGKILIAGVENDAPRGVIGGTGDFANARGQGNLVNFDPDFGLNPDHDTFTIAFSLTGASGPAIT